METSTTIASSSSSSTPAAATVEDLPADVLRLVLRRLDGASLASLGSASSAFRGLADDPDTWRALCLATWPSVRGLPATLFSGAGGHAYRSLYADAFPFPFSTSPPSSGATCARRRRLPARLVSAVDLCHGGVHVMSRVVDTDATCPWFLGSPFRVDALVQEGFTIVTPSSSSSSSMAAFVFAPEELTLSWILIDPATGRAVNASSRRPVCVDRPPRWQLLPGPGAGNGDAVARFCVVIAGDGEDDASAVAMEAAVTCDGGGRGHVREVSLTCASTAGEGGGGVSGEDALAAVAAAMAGPRRCGRRGEEEEEEARRRSYEEFGKRKRERKEWKKRREGAIDLCCSGVVGAAALVAFLVLLVFR